MKKLLIPILLLPVTIWAQQKITGNVKNDKNQILAEIKVEIKDNDGKTIKTAFTDANGNFSVDEIHCPYILVIEDLEYSKFQKNVECTNPEKPWEITLQSETKEIDAVALTKKKPVVTRKIDRLQFNVENSNISSLNAWEILKKTPSVVFSGDDFKIKGSTAILVTINDKKVLISGDELKTLLENTQGSDVKSVEVITNPPAKYDASGGAVLNIVMKETKTDGYRGYVSAKYVQSIYPKGVVTLSQSYKKDKFSANASYSRGAGAYYREETNYIYYPEDQTTWRGTLNRKDIDNQQNSVNANLNYALDDKTNITLGYRGFFGPKSAGIYHVPTIIYDASDNPVSSYNTINDHHSRTINNNLSFQVERKFGKSSLSMTTYYITNNKTKYQSVRTDLDFQNQTPSSQTFISDNGQDIKLFSNQVDYKWKSDKWELESGAKYSLVKTTSKLDFSDDENGNLVPRPDKSNLFNYSEAYVALYASATFNWKKWSFKGGLRAENTDLNGVVSEPYEHNANQYWKLFPTLFVQYETEDKQQFGFSYGKRISRPSYSWLNPGKSYFNLFNYFQGDPRLKATITHNFSLTYNVKDWNFEVYYRKDIDPSMEINFQIPDTKMLVYQYTNIQKSSAYGISVYKNFQLKPWWTLSVSEEGYHNQNFFWGLDKKLYKNEKFILASSISTSFVLDKASDWRLEVGHQYNSPGVQGTFTFSGSWTSYFVMNKKFFNKTLEASLFFNDIFKTSTEKIATKYANQNNYFFDYQDTQQVSLQLKYNFGNQKLKASKTVKNADEQNRM